MGMEAPLRAGNSFAQLGSAGVFAVNVVGFYGVGALLRDLLGTVHIGWFSQTSVGWRLAGAFGYAVVAHYWSVRGRASAGPSRSRPAV
jgi:hypothetical protein